MGRTVRVMWQLALTLSTVGCIWACSCEAPKPACAYLEADAIFVGRVAFTNDDGSGTFVQATLVRFEVEEAFKGVPDGTHEIWVDPGSFTSCYETHELGGRYLVFAAKAGRGPVDTAAITVVRRRTKGKPLPPGIDPANPPPVYYAPECSGTRPADYSMIEKDLAMLRAYRTGQELPRVVGYVYLSPFKGWPELNGPSLGGARVRLDDGRTKLTATTDSEGRFSLREAPAGDYSVAAELAPFVVTRPWWMLRVPPVGCGSVDVELRTTSELRGTVVDDQNRPVRGTPVQVVVNESTDLDGTAIFGETDSKGRFAIVGVPEADVLLSAGPAVPSTDMPYHGAYYHDASAPAGPAILRLKAGEQKAGITLRLSGPLKTHTVAVRVTYSDGKPASEAGVWASVDSVVEEGAPTSRDETVRLRCIDGIRYSVEAGFRHELDNRSVVFKSSPVMLDCSESQKRIHLVLDHAESGL